MAKTKVGVLGATGSVGQRFILLLKDHPTLELVALGASSRSAGKKYSEAVNWQQTTLLPDEAADITVSPCDPSYFTDCKVVFSGLDADVAGDVEKAFAEAGLAVISNAKNYRRDPHVPLVVPLVNTDHLSILKSRKTPGFIVCNSNCSTAGLVVPLKALSALGPIDAVSVTTMQALSGAGFSPGVPSMAILDNVIPFIGGEEEKMEYETRKILGSVSADGTTIADIPASDIKVSAQCNRVAVTDGHLECVSMRFAHRPPPTLEQVKEALRTYECAPQSAGCPSAPKHAIHLLEQPDRPQPRLDRDRDAGYGVSVGRVREDPLLDYKFVVLSHNTVIGAAGSGILIAEYLITQNVI
ncbi:hypothetical protein CANCADRAFT_1043 [Tortispora caseinolytica NRRL Y-17796]|uniref:Aspartate-semialdehyde dehydrogenase n=1 Tax=Tortispora caseinolytica NRRL Y-17796 TaxID=767744 RepID=A0A1E4TL18_9ASCO|nr:hypothetical protein CANCADRAFT_1043 [Tortispora caseinolytica NRRL Y-17796]